ncbi:MAG: hypothetical protein LAT55_13715 [Opitutales bacterium]|nr:hypothetical protein [Opitutales bacterium]
MPVIQKNGGAKRLMDNRYAQAPRVTAVPRRTLLSITALQNALLMLVCLWITAPMLVPNPTMRLLALFAMVGWLVLELARPNGLFRRPSWPLLLVIVLAAHDLFLWYVFREWSLLSRIQFYIFLSFILVYESRRQQPATLLPVFWFLVLTVPIWILTTLRGLDVFGAHAVRHVVRSSELAIELMQQGVGGYSLVYGSILLLPIALSIAIAPERFRLTPRPRLLRLLPIPIRWLFAGLAALILLLVFRSGFTIAIIVASSITVVTLALLKPRRWHFAALPLVIAFLIGFGEVLVDGFIEVARPIVAGTNYQNKLRDFEVSRIEGTAHGTVADRTARYMRSVNSFIENPLLGTMRRQGIGNHSAVLDNFAQRGVFFGLLYFWLLVYLPIRMLKQRPRNVAMIIGTLTMMLLFPILNSVTMIFGVFLFIMFPAACAMTRDDPGAKASAGIVNPVTSNQSSLGVGH